MVLREAHSLAAGAEHNARVAQVGHDQVAPEEQTCDRRTPVRPTASPSLRDHVRLGGCEGREVHFGERRHVERLYGWGFGRRCRAVRVRGRKSVAARRLAVAYKSALQITPERAGHGCGGSCTTVPVEDAIERALGPHVGTHDSVRLTTHASLPTVVRVGVPILHRLPRPLSGDNLRPDVPVARPSWPRRL